MDTDVDIVLLFSQFRVFYQDVHGIIGNLIIEKRFHKFILNHAYYTGQVTRCYKIEGFMSISS